MLYLDAMSSFWREWVINYDFSHQKNLGEEAARGTQSNVARLRVYARKKYNALLNRARSIQSHLLRSPRSWGLGSAGVLGLIVLLAGIPRLWRFLRLRRLTAHPEDSPQQAAALWYLRTTHSLARRGWKRSPSQTAAEYLLTIDDAETRRSLARFIEHYESARFGNSSEDARQLPDLYEEIATTSRK